MSAIPEPLPDPCHLLWPPGAEVRPAQIARELAPILGVMVSDLTGLIRYGGGFLLKGVNGERARRVIDQIDAPLLCIPDDCPLTLPVSRTVRTVVYYDERLELVFADGEKVRFAIGDFVCLFVAIRGQLDDDAEEKVRPGFDRAAADIASATAPFAPQRQALSAPGLTMERAVIHLVAPEPIEFVNIELGALFPDLALTGGLSAIDNWLSFLGHLMERMPEPRVLPETVRFWREGQLENVLFTKREELDNRMMWLAELIARRMWEPFR